MPRITCWSRAAISWYFQGTKWLQVAVSTNN